LQIGITGRKRDLTLKIMEFLFPISSNKTYTLETGVRLDLTNRSERLLYYFFYNVERYFEKSPLGLYIKKTIKKDEVFLDIGANMGMYSLLVKKNEGIPIVFEPEPSLKKFFIRIKDIYINYYDVAISNQEKNDFFYISDDTNVGASSLISSKNKWKESGYVEKIEIKTSRLQKVLSKNILSNVKLVKIDVEGAEEMVISGMLDILKYNHFEIWCEVRGDSSDRSPNSYIRIIEMLLPFGYKPYIYDSKQDDVRSFNEDLDVMQVFDILFL